MKFHQASLCREPYSTAQKVDAVAAFVGLILLQRWEVMVKGKVALVNSSVLKPQGVWLLGGQTHQVFKPCFSSFLACLRT